MCYLRWRSRNLITAFILFLDSVNNKKYSNNTNKHCCNDSCNNCILNCCWALFYVQSNNSRFLKWIEFFNIEVKQTRNYMYFKSASINVTLLRKQNASISVGGESRIDSRWIELWSDNICLLNKMGPTGL